MSFRSYRNVVLALFSFVLITHAAYNYYTKKKQKTTRKKINEVIMFSYGVGELKKSKYSRCVITQSMERLLFYLNSPRYTLDICMFVMTNLDLINSVLKLLNKGVKIRIIIDADMAFSSGSNIRRFEKQGIPVRWMKSTNLMHHKFALIDASSDNSEVMPVVMAGSLNWTNQALSGNWEDVIVTSQRELVQQYKTEFERLWALFKPIVD